MTQGNYIPAAGRPLSRQEFYAAMAEQQNQQQQQQNQPQPSRNGQPEGQEPIQPAPELSKEEREAIENQRLQAQAGAGIGGQAATMRPPLVIGQAPDGGPLRLDPALVSNARMLGLGFGVGALIVLAWSYRNQRLTVQTGQAAGKQE